MLAVHSVAQKSLVSVCQSCPVRPCVVINLASVLCGLREEAAGPAGNSQSDGQGSVFNDRLESVSIKTEGPLVSLLASGPAV